MTDDSPPADGRDGDDPDARTCLVAVRPPTFERCRDGFYPVPIDYDRTEASFEYLGLYRTAPVSAITHYAPVTDRFVDDGSWMGEDTYETLIGRFSDAEAAVVLSLGPLRELATPVTDDAHGVRGAWYCRLADLWGAETLSDL